jgi:hypothetical protein
VTRIRFRRRARSGLLASGPAGKEELSAAGSLMRLESTGTFGPVPCDPPPCLAAGTTFTQNRQCIRSGAPRTVDAESLNYAANSSDGSFLFPSRCERHQPPTAADRVLTAKFVASPWACKVAASRPTPAQAEPRRRAFPKTMAKPLGKTGQMSSRQRQSRGRRRRGHCPHSRYYSATCRDMVDWLEMCGVPSYLPYLRRTPAAVPSTGPN